MNQLSCRDLWSTVGKLAKKSSAKRAAIAYVSSDRLVRFGEGDILITDASNQAIGAGQTSAPVLTRAHRRGATLYSLNGLHCKVLLFDGTAVIGSANVSESSVTSLVEAAWMTDAPAAVGMVASLIHDLSKTAAPIDETFLKRISKIKVTKRPARRMGPKLPRNLGKSAPQCWIIGVHDLNNDFPEEEAAIESGMSSAESELSRSSSAVEWIRFTGKSRFRTEAKRGDVVIQIWSKDRSRTPSAVYRHSPILHRQTEKRCTRIFVEGFANSERTSITWTQFKKLVRRIGLPKEIRPRSIRPITDAHSEALFSLWNE